ncbi:hypothetical protein HGRIS_002661 [Hohenbuehelia grisea]|uniref:Alpha/beta hydrolase fold-3 domain-containing protein n=1 Tax=Hohenbuehelia grisea TaxID=104357 RepID=A0ABR3JM31_9AGAR
MAFLLFHYQPFRALYLTYEILTTVFVRVPFWVVTSLPRSWRPRPAWSLKRVVNFNLLCRINRVFKRIDPVQGIPNHLALESGVNVNGVWVEAAPQLVTSPLKEWAHAASVAPLRIPGYWLHKKTSSIPVGAPPMPKEKVVYALHGGAYIALSAHPNSPVSAIPKGLLKHVGTVHRVFSIEYRLSGGLPHKSQDENPFPAALLDAIAGYNYLVNVVGFDPTDIILDGDSAGANLALALTRYLVEHQNDTQVKLPKPPGSLLLLSPWADLSFSHDIDPKTSTSHLNHKSDFIDMRSSNKWMQYAKRVYTGPHGLGAAEVNAYISPASLHYSVKDSATGPAVLFKGFPRTFIVGGGAEVLIGQIRTLKDRMIRDLGEGDGVKPGEGKVRYYEVPDGIHDYLIFAWHEPERTETSKAIAAWIDQTVQ